MKKFMLLVFSVGLFLMGSQAKADNASKFTFAVRASTISFSSAAVLVNTGHTWYFGKSFSTGPVNTDWLDVYDSSKAYTTSDVLGLCAGHKKLTDWNTVNVVLSTAGVPGSSLGVVASELIRERPIEMTHGLVVAPSVHTYSFITVYWADPRE